MVCYVTCQKPEAMTDIKTLFYTQLLNFLVKCQVSHTIQIDWGPNFYKDHIRCLFIVMQKKSL